MSTTAILPVKGSANAKRRLGEGLAAPHRRALAEAMFRDVLETVLSSPGIDRVLVVAASDRPAEIAAEHGVTAIRDGEAGHNAAAALGLAHARRQAAERALLIPGDCPALDPDELARLLAHPAPPPSALIVPDRHGTGTNALLLTPPSALRPSFGPGSCRRHVAQAAAAGIHAEVLEVASLAADVDTPEDLSALEALLDSITGRATHTRRCLAALR